MKIGFDFDKIFVGNPPMLPDDIVQFLYKNGIFFWKRNGEMCFHKPKAWEQKIILVTHKNFMRPVIKRNVEALVEISSQKKHELYLVSGRYSFLKKRTMNMVNNMKLKKYFKKIFINLFDEQPHIFKESVLKKEKIKIFLDDNLEVLEYLSKKLPEVSFFWISNEKWHNSSRITPVKDLETFYNQYLLTNGE